METGTASSPSKAASGKASQENTNRYVALSEPEEEGDPQETPIEEGAPSSPAKDQQIPLTAQHAPIPGKGKKPQARQSTKTKNSIPIILEEESQGESDGEPGRDPSSISNAKKPGRKPSRKKREEIADREKDLGLQSTLDSSFGKEHKGSKENPSPVPSKGGAQKPISK
jgi:hypothetical protein